MIAPFIEETPGLRNVPERLWEPVRRFIRWLEIHGYETFDPYDIWGTKYGLWSRRLYYKRPKLGLPLIAPILTIDLLLPGLRSLFVNKKRYATADAHLALAFLNLYQLTDAEAFLIKARQLAADLLVSSISGYSGHCWGYPFDWQANNGLWKEGTPFITTTPYCFEVFVRLFDVTKEEKYLQTARSIAKFVYQDLPETPTSPDAAAGSYSPFENTHVINASAYRAMVLFEAAHRFYLPSYSQAAQRNLNFILQSQRADGAWLYGLNNPDECFIDNFHTCFVLKNLYKLNLRLRSGAVSESIARGFQYYRTHLFDEKDLPKPFAIKPRAQIVQYKLYDFAEAITLSALLRDDIPAALPLAQRLSDVVCDRYQCRDGYFATQAYVGSLKHTFPFLRWPQAQLFHALTYLLLATEKSTIKQAPASLTNSEKSATVLCA